MLVIADYELSDFIDDYLTEECEIPYESRADRDRDGGQVITLYFPASTRIAEVEESLLKLSPAQVEEIYLLNNKPS
jgi:hypothetical protein